MKAKEAKKVKKTSWTETIKGMEVGSELFCTVREKLSAGSIISRLKTERPDIEFSKWISISENKWKVTRIK